MIVACQKPAPAPLPPYLTRATLRGIHVLGPTRRGPPARKLLDLDIKRSFAQRVYPHLPLGLVDLRAYEQPATRLSLARFIVGRQNVIFSLCRLVGPHPTENERRASRQVAARMLWNWH